MTNATSQKYALAIHTASADLGLAISNFAGDERVQSWSLNRDLSTHLHIYLTEFLQPQTWKDLMFLAVARGPGGFTGTRIGVVAARTLAQQLEIPLFAVSTLTAIAWMHRASNFSTDAVPDLAIQMQAQRGEIHTAIYSANLQTRLADTIMSQLQWQQVLDQWQHPYRLIQAESGLGTTAAGVLDLGYQDWQRGDRPDWSEALPFYGQSPV
ncbi:tRNA (adenosine(37)-N6)-threonylcarbamoyltransferase complex dimerization subunit type 1 TsaB [Phormidium tenue FACHB-886]|nr:tRNA (adenosine(37)-N6)-threonylcarbamoyltransferase complex dimerization subunit type 1 TsaB [Phormidium tenue FACHB-886]